MVDAAGTHAGEGLDWVVRPLPRDEVVVDRPTPSARGADPALGELLALLSQPSYEETLHVVTAPPTRHSLDPGFVIAAETAAAVLQALGYVVVREPIIVGAGHSENVVADLAGTAEAPRGLVVVSAHLDSVNHADGPDAPAPGADDNASGAAGLLELARALVTRRWPHDLRLILFGGEEQGLFGSKAHVAALDEADRGRVRAVLNMDMIARLNTPAPGVLLEGAEVSRTLVDELAAAAATWTSLAVSTSLHPYASDHVPFIDAGIPAVLTIEGNDTANDDVHTARDTLATLYPPLALEILRMNLAVLATYLEADGGADGAVPARTAPTPPPTAISPAHPPETTSPS
ncbi:Zn-dependent exopeptidase M28 [Georgenia yuyongxinii]|uniref:Zn-dependent exopeptidase M28 n=1 Tax=Georgenia yuyongxinii TaxID=2589797 RepID=A0A5B8C804_9MICO|nr:Zn-dependent exopeptidase M28 [Georgenia yuyongxinii]